MIAPDRRIPFGDCVFDPDTGEVTRGGAPAVRLQEQMAEVERGAAAIEARVETAREQSDEANREGFARRAAL